MFSLYYVYDARMHIQIFYLITQLITQLQRFIESSESLGG